MIKNIHPYERVVRIGGGLFLSSLAFWGPRNKAFLSFLIPVGTGVAGTCPVYSAMGVSTLPREQDKPQDVEKQANDYFPVESDSEIAAGHPIVGVS